MVVFIQAAEKVAGQLAAAFIVAAVNTWKIKHSISLTGGSLEQVISACLFGVMIIWVKEHRWYWLINSPREQRMPSGAVLTSSLSRAWTCRKREQLQEQHCITFTEHGSGNNKTIQPCITWNRKEGLLIGLVQRNGSQKWNFCHYLFTIMSVQLFMQLFYIQGLLIMIQGCQAPRTP